MESADTLNKVAINQMQRMPGHALSTADKVCASGIQRADGGCCSGMRSCFGAHWLSGKVPAGNSNCTHHTMNARLML
jgi:hypothetical protein